MVLMRKRGKIDANELVLTLTFRSPFVLVVGLCALFGLARFAFGQFAPGCEPIDKLHGCCVYCLHESVTWLLSMRNSELSRKIYVILHRKLPMVSDHHALFSTQLAYTPA